MTDANHVPDPPDLDPAVTEANIEEEAGAAPAGEAVPVEPDSPSHSTPVEQVQQPTQPANDSSEEVLGWVSTGVSAAGLTVVPLIGSVAGLILGYISKRKAVSKGVPTPVGATAGIVMGWVGVGVAALIAVLLAGVIALAVLAGLSKISTPAEIPRTGPEMSQQWQSGPQGKHRGERPGVLPPPGLDNQELQQDLQKLLDMLSEDTYPQSMKLGELLGMLEKYQSPRP